MPGAKPTSPFPISSPSPTGGDSPETPRGSGATISNQVVPAKKSKSVSSNDPASVSRKLKAFKPRGNNREKLVTLLDELKTLDIGTYPHAFCFLIRSLFEISAKIYCKENTIAKICILQKNGKDKTLINLLGEITKFLTSNGEDKEKTKELHGALAELAKKDGLLSVTSMNQLVHNPKFSVSPNDICLLFHNIFPLFEAMNS